MSGWVKGLAVAAVTVMSVALVVPPAQAAVSPSVISVKPSGTTCVASTATLQGNPGDRFSVVVQAGCAVVGDSTVGSAQLSPGVFYKVGPGSSTITLGAVSSGPLVLETYPRGGDGRVTLTRVAVTITNDLVVPSSGSQGGHDDLQQIGVPASGSCEDVDIEVGHLPGYPVGGWSKSWAWWINGGRGGPVCTREVETLPSGQVILL